MKSATSIESPRDQLRRVMDVRNAAYAERDRAKVVLQRAEAILGSVEAGMERHRQATAIAGEGHAREMAEAIKRGAQLAVSQSNSMRAARDALVNAEAHYSVAKGARDHLSAELGACEQRAKHADTIVSAAALAVVTSEAELIAKDLEPTFAKLLGITDYLRGLARLWSGTGPIVLAPGIRSAIIRLQSLSEFLEAARPQRPAMTASPEAVVGGRLQKYLSALAVNPDISLAEIPAPEMTRPFIPAHNEIEAQEIAAVTRASAA